MGAGGLFGDDFWSIIDIIILFIISKPLLPCWKYYTFYS
jgi:hypothetical protein